MNKKLTLNKETIRELTENEAKQVGGGYYAIIPPESGPSRFLSCTYVQRCTQCC